MNGYELGRYESKLRIDTLSAQLQIAVETLKRLIHLNCCEQEGIGAGMPSPKQWQKAFDNAIQAIVSIEETIQNWRGNEF